MATGCAAGKDVNARALTPFGLTCFDFEGVSLMVSRTGYTGDLGYEVWVDPDHAEVLWDRLIFDPVPAFAAPGRWGQRGNRQSAIG